MAQQGCETPSAELSTHPAESMQALSQPSASGVQRVNPLTEPDWNESLPAHPERCFFHLAEWARVLQETYGYAPCYFTLQAGRRREALLPLMEVDSWLSGRRGVGLPFTDFCAPLLSERSRFPQLLEQAVEYGLARGWRYLELRGGRSLLASAQPSQSFYVHTLSLSANEPELAAGLKDSVRRAIRRAEKLGVTAVPAEDLEAVREFYTLQCQTRRRHGLPPQPFRFFAKIHEHILSRERGLLVLARQGSRAVAGAVFFHAGEEATFKFGASHKAYQGLRGNDLVMWTALKHYAGRGFRRMNLGRTSLANAGLRRFKLAWGAQEQLLDYSRYDLKQRAFVPGKDEAFGWHNRVFRLLPLGVSRWVGALAYRHVA